MRSLASSALAPALALALTFAACGDDAPPNPDAGPSLLVRIDAGPGAADSGVAGAGPPPRGCDELGLPRIDMQPSTGTAYGDVASDFTVQTLDGPFTLSDEWTGCDTYVFVNYADSATARAIFDSVPDPIFERSARNARYFFTSYESNAASIQVRMETLRTNFETAFAALSPEDAEHWRARVHFILEPLLDITGGPGARANDQPGIAFAFGIDRDQRWDPVGSFSEFTRGGIVARLGMASWVSHYYNYRAALDARLAGGAGVTIVPLVSETDWSERVFDRAIDLPDAATMAGFDTLEFDVQIDCHGSPRTCSEWDRIAKIAVCVDGAVCDDRRELVRWITPYSRPGRRRWAIDASPLLGLLRAGGTQSFRITMGPPWEAATLRDVEMSLRLSDRGTGELATGAERAYTGRAFDAMYNASHPPFRFTPPTGTTRVELVSIVSGHGQTDGDNCAEWCNHEHALTVNGGTTHRIDYPGMAGQPHGCAELAGDGVIPGQYGNWAPLRAGWCPGYPVDAVRFDVTADVDLTMENELVYVAQFAGGEPRGGNIDLSVYVVYY